MLGEVKNSKEGGVDVEWSDGGALAPSRRQVCEVKGGPGGLTHLGEAGAGGPRGLQQKRQVAH